MSVQADAPVHRSERGAKISASRKARTWMYPPPLPNPSVGDLAKVGGHSCVWAACLLCRQERWVRTKRGGLPVHPNCISCTTNETRLKLSLNEKGRKHSPERIEKNRQVHLGQVIGVEARRKISVATKGRRRTQEVKDRMSRIQRRLWANPEYKDRVMGILKEAQRERWRDYVPISYSTIRELRSSDAGTVGDTVMLCKGLAVKLLCDMCGKPLWVRLVKGIPRNLRCHPCASRKMWTDYPSTFATARLKWQESIRKSLHMRPNRAEQALFVLLEKLSPGDWKYVGDWEFVLAGKNPDFVNINGKKQIVELFGDYWHKGEDPAERIALFREFGYETLVVWEAELKDLTRLTERVGEFVR